MRVRETLHECVHGYSRKLLRRLIDLEDVVVLSHLATIDGERDDQLYVVLAAEVGYGLHLRRIERTEDDVALGCSRIGKRSSHIGVNGHVPCLHVGLDALRLKAVTCHQHAAIILHHALSVAVNIVKRKHHAHTHHAHFLLLAGSGRRRRSRTRDLRRLRRGVHLAHRGERDEELVALLKHIVRLLHAGIGVLKFVYGDIEFLGNAVYRVFLLHLVKVLPLHILTA